MLRQKKLLIIPLVLMALTIRFITVYADDEADRNRYRIPVECRKYFQMAQKHRNDTLSILYSDSMRMKAIEIKDTFAYIAALMEPCYYYCNTYNIPKMNESAKKLRKAALEMGYMTYYFRSYQTLINAHLERQAFSNALQVVDEMHHKAFEMKDNYGIWLGYTTMAEIYEKLDNQPMRRSALTSAIKYRLYVTDKNVSSIYVHLAETEPDLNKRLATLQEGEALAKTFVDSAMLNSGYMKYYAEKGDRDKFLKLYDKIISSPQYPRGYSQINRVVFEAYSELFRGHKEKAEAILTDSKETLGDRYPRYMARVNRYADDYKKAFAWHLKDDSLRLNAQQNVIVQDLYAYNVRSHGDSLQYAMDMAATKNARLEAERAKAMAENARLEAERQQAAAENAKLIADKQRGESERAKVLAEARQKEAEIKLLRSEQEKNQARMDEIEQQRLKAEADRKLAQMKVESERKNTMMAILTGFFLLLIVIVMALVMSVRKTRRNLKKIAGLNAELSKAQAAAEQASKMKDLFIQNMSHEIRTPMNAIVGFSQILTYPGIPIDDQEKEEYGTHIMNNAQMLTMLIDDILNISDIESGEFTITKRDTEIHKILDAAESVTQYRVPSLVQFSIIDELPEGYSCSTDARRVQQILVNYITNACKHTEKGSIVLNVKHDESKKNLIFSVTDTGTGIPKDQAENIFERFTKLNNFKQGTGLGLNICQNVAQKLGGRVWLDTTYTDGARFCLEIPCQ